MVDVIIVGGGASGLICGIEAAKRGKQCLILEQKEKAGKKLYATGNGKCNFANRNVDMSFYHSVHEQSQKLISCIITGTTCHTIETYFAELGIPSMERQGYLYPRSEQAAALVLALEQVFLQWRGRILCEERVEYIHWNSEHSNVQVKTANHCYEGKTVVLATGGTAASKLGSDGSGYTLVKSMGHTVTSCVPALCGLQCKEKGWNRLQGVRAKGHVQIWQDTVLMGQDTGEIQFTQYGVSGIVIFNLSRYAGLGLQKQKNITLVFDFFPEYSEGQMLNRLKQLQDTCGFRRISDVMSGFLPGKLAEYILDKVQISKELPCAQLTPIQLQTLIPRCKQMKVRILGTNSFEQAQVTAGGVPLHEIDISTMESRIQPGCYLVGELLDVDGACGGYNLMWAWETGRRAGMNL